MLDKKAYKLLDLFYKKDRLTFDEIQSETHEEERESSSLCVSALCSEKFILVQGLQFCALAHFLL